MERGFLNFRNVGGLSTHPVIVPIAIGKGVNLKAINQQANLWLTPFFSNMLIINNLIHFLAQMC